jgi:glycosyltransferase involved in cell wall biosynthesis
MALALAHGLLQAGWEVRLIALDRDREMALPGTAAEQAALSARIRTLSQRSSRASTVIKALAFPGLLIRLEQLIAEEELASVISFMERANLLNLAGWQRAVRIVSVRKHITMALAAKPWLKRRLIVAAYPRLLRRAAAVVFNARGSAADFMRSFPIPAERTAVIPNTVDDVILEQARSPPTGPGTDWLGPYSVVAAGRLISDKGFVSLLRAFRQVLDRIPRARLIILGDGPLRAHLLAVAAALGISEHVVLTGFQNSPYSWLARAGVFALPSRSEGFPNALLEAMRLGRACVATDCPTGPRELLAPEAAIDQVVTGRETTAYGVLIPPIPRTDLPAHAPLDAGESALAEALAELLEDNGLRDRLGTAAAAHAAGYTPQAALAQWQSLLRKQLALRDTVSAGTDEQPHH